MKKILVVSTSPVLMNGIIVVIKNYYSRFNKDKFDIEFVFPSVIVDNLYDEIKDIGKVHIIGRNIKNIIMYVLRMYKLMRHNKYDVMHVHGNSSTIFFELLAAKLAGVKVRIVHSHNTTCSNKTLHSFLHPMFRVLYTHAFACGKEAGKWMFKNGEFIVINNGIELNKYRFDRNIRNNLRKKLNLEDKIVLGHVGGFHHQKNHDFLIDMISNLYNENSKYHLVLVGGGVRFEEIKSLVEKKGLINAVTFVGIVNNPYEYYQMFDVFVLPSFYEGLPLVAVEAQASGLPCVISDAVSPGVELTKLVHFCGLHSGVSGWTDLIWNLKNDKREEESNNAICSLRNAGFDITENVRSLEAFYENAIG